MARYIGSIFLGVAGIVTVLVGWGRSSVVPRGEARPRGGQVAKWASAAVGGALVLLGLAVFPPCSPGLGRTYVGGIIVALVLVSIIAAVTMGVYDHLSDKPDRT